MKKVACFFTWGWTELNAMKMFLGKINKNIEFIQCCPTGEKRRKNPLKREMGRNHNGLTGEGLFSYTYEYLRKYKDKIQEYDAVLIEDDLDGKYHEIYNEENYKEKISEVRLAYQNDISTKKAEIRAILGKNDSFPVFIMHASPEIESWFCADWKNTFGYIYGPEVDNKLSTRVNDFFSISFKRYLEDNVLLQYKDCLELYGSFGTDYRKLSDKIIDALNGAYKVELESNNEDIVRTIKYNRELSYSKKYEGQKMLMYLDPKALSKECMVFFRDTMNEIKNI